jgi:YD repeat-containing protein
LDFLHYPTAHSDSRASSVSDLHRTVTSSEDASSVLAYGVNTESFDLFLPLMPQSGSSKIVFASNRDGSMQIYSMNSDGSGQTRLTYSGANDDYPRWSPNGSKIVFQSDRDNPDTGVFDIYVMNADGSGQTRLTTDANDDSAAAWSPDGSKIAFQSARNGVNYQIYVMNADGSGQVNISNTTANDAQPSWSPDGTKIAFASDRDQAGFSSIYVMNANGSNQTRLTFSGSGFRDEQPAWSPNGAKLAFVSTRNSDLETWQETDDDGSVITKSKLHVNKEVYVMNATGSNQVRLTNTLENDDSPAWSGDGTKIVFRSDRERDCCDPNAQVWMMNPDGNSQVNISSNGFGDYSASWTSTSNQSPVANAGGAYSAATAQTINFNGGGSFDSDGSVVSYSWNFGDGGTGSGAVPLHSYAATGTYTVSLTVTDNLGAQGSATTTATISTSTANAYTQNFIQVALARQPNPDEVNYWEDVFRAAYAHQQGSMTIAVREMARTIFESADYAARGRNDHWYVYDLYETYLMRYPDADGWAWWEGQCNSYGREQVRRAFDECGEFAGNVAAITPNGSATAAVSSLLSARVDPNNQTGNQLLARDAEWGVSLLSLSGRAGLDLGLGLSYSSAVWTRSGPYSYFDEDNGTISPGFRLGFPTVQEVFFDAQVGVNARLLITASGRRVELRQIGSSNVYEAADSSYLQLIDYGGSLLVRSADGTQMSYVKRQDEWRCIQIEDRNGNLISVNNNDQGDITSITDTLGRVITFNYDGNSNLISITQTWSGQTHIWATFGWGNLSIQPNLPGVVGTHSGDMIPVLTQVGLDDGSFGTFEYNANGQVNLIRRYTSDNVQRSYMSYDYAASPDGSPRLTGQRVWAENWTGINGLPSEVVTQFADPGDGSHVMTTPDGTIYKEFYGGGWQRGLTVRSEVWSGGSQQKVSTTAWIQDNQNGNYQTNPRVIETNVYDSVRNRRRATVEYNQGYGLPTHVREYGGSDGQTLLRLTTTAYKGDAVYMDRRIIGLPYERIVYDGPTGNLMSRQIFHYDWGDPYFSTETPATNYDVANYPSWFIVGRGNLVAVRRYSCENNNTAYDENQASWVQLNGYNMAGALLWTQDAASHRINLSYSDSFSDGNNGRGTLAYPTTLTDADGYSSYVQYNYDFGGRMRVQGPPPANQSIGIVQAFTYDNAVRLQQVTTANNNAYTRYVYGPNYTQSFSTVNNIADDAYSVQVFDGAGRVFAAATNHPGSVGGYSAVYSIHDVMGRVFKQSNPTEITGGWAPTGDDGAGWIFTQQTYDWKGRPLLTTHLTDGTTKQASYSTCGCAGSDVVTLTDEVGRQQKVYSDVLGRTAKTEVLNWDGTVYSTRVLAYNARDQITSAKQYQGADWSGIYQEVSETYDGYGRLQTRKAPIETSETSYTYYANDKPLTVTDARGATTTYGYNSRGLVTAISYSGPAPVPGAISYGYDAAGNRTSMTDETGSVTYRYDQLSRMQSETRQFAGISGNFMLSYEYNLAGAMKAITDPTGSRVDYAYDSGARLSGITGSGANSVPTYASGFAYRAWGGVKDFDLGSGIHQHLDFNARLQNTSLVFSNVNVGTMSWSYDHYADGKLSRVSETYDPRFDRFFDYDHEGRIANALTGSEARGGSTVDGPYRQSYAYDVWENTTSRTYRVGWAQNTQTETVSYPNNRHQFWGYDNAGNVTGTLDANFDYDAAGRQNSFVSRSLVSNNQSMLEVAQTFDGDATPARKTETSRYEDSTIHESTTTTYYLRSTVLDGKVVAELDNTGYKRKGYIYADGMQIAQQDIWNPGYGGQVTFETTSPATGSIYLSDSAHNVIRKELDPLGADVNTASGPTPVEPPFYNPKFDQMPIQIEAGPSNDFGVSSWYLNMVNKDFDRHMAETYWQHGFRDIAQQIMAQNPNVGIQYRVSGFGLDGPQSGAVWGAQAAAFLYGLSNALDRGLLVSPQDGHGTSPPGANATPQTATGGRRNTVIITYSDGTEEVRSGGTRTWRNNNPGNIRPGNLDGEIGSAGGFTVFSSEDAGLAAIPALLLRPRYQALTVFGAIATWAPPGDNNDTAAYQRRVQDLTGIDGQTRMNTLDANQLQSVVNAIRNVEGWTVGTVTYRRPRR